MLKTECKIGMKVIVKKDYPNSVRKGWLSPHDDILIGQTVTIIKSLDRDRMNSVRIRYTDKEGCSNSSTSVYIDPADLISIEPKVPVIGPEMFNEENLVF